MPIRAAGSWRRRECEAGATEDSFTGAITQGRSLH